MDIKMEVQYTDGYEKRFTESMLEQISKRHGSEGAQPSEEEKKTA